MKICYEDQYIRFLTGCYCSISDLIVKDGRAVELDLGCGSGLFTTNLAKLYPDRQIIAADIMIGRVRKLQRRNMREKVDNMELLRVEGRHLLGYMLPDALIDRLHILCPDPWPKTKHRAQRLLCSEFTTHIHRVLKPGGCFHFSSDDIPYFEMVERVVEASGVFKRDDSLLTDISHLKTDFEIRWIDQGKKVHHAAWCNTDELETLL